MAYFSREAIRLKTEKDTYCPCGARRLITASGFVCQGSCPGVTPYSFTARGIARAEFRAAWPELISQSAADTLEIERQASHKPKRIKQC